MTASNSSGESTQSNTLTVTTLPTAPTNLLANNSLLTTTTAGLSFTAPSGNATVTYTPYIINTNGTSTKATGSGSPNSYTITGLTSNTKYSFAITATNSSGESTQSTQLSITTAPDAPTNLKAIDVSFGTVTISFTPPPGPFGGAVSSNYTLYYINSNIWYSTTIPSNNTGTFTITNLSAKTSLTKEMLQRNVELYLMKNNLIEVRPTGRALTKKGHDYHKQHLSK